MVFYLLSIYFFLGGMGGGGEGIKRSEDSERLTGMEAAMAIDSRTVSMYSSVSHYVCLEETILRPYRSSV